MPSHFTPSLSPNHKPISRHATFSLSVIQCHLSLYHVLFSHAKPCLLILHIIPPAVSSFVMPFPLPFIPGPDPSLSLHAMFCHAMPSFSFHCLYPHALSSLMLHHVFPHAMPSLNPHILSSLIMPLPFFSHISGEQFILRAVIYHLH